MKENEIKEQEVRLWNPNATANWSLLFTPIFGAWLQSKNWKALNEDKKSNNVMYWAYTGIVVIVVALVLPDVKSARGLSFAFLLLWYFFSGRKQASYIKEHNINYIKKGWLKPLGIASLPLVAFFFLAGVANMGMREKTIVETTVPLVSNIIKEQLGGSAVCKAVNLDKEIAKDFYYATAYLDNGNTLNISVEVKGNQVLVAVLE